ncbi:hypothetical protein AYO45_01905 [Gammaproteobacteria bacterium SCGC AG-212-F23]|nr:hypothetical protein AYO45_01905 [Gammaproteobacteria bacterium SCGC AG-212-F23]
MIEKIVSGGQTGVDRAALDVAIITKIPHGGWCPKGRKAEDGTIHQKYRLKETKTDDYSERTKMNIVDSDATLILVPSKPIKVTDGTILTINEVVSKKKPHLVIDLSDRQNMAESIIQWINEHNIKVLNVAGPRESQSPGIYKIALDFLESIIKKLSIQKKQSVCDTFIRPRL